MENPLEIQKQQGTRLSNKAPWETYSNEMDTKMSPELLEAVKRYEERAHHKISQEAEEELARQREINCALSADYQWVTPEEYEYVGPRIGKIMHSSELILKLREECNLDCWFITHGLPRRLTLIVKRPYGVPEFGVWVMDGFMPEYSIMKFDDHFVPLDERLRGWRTVLLQLILKGLVTEEAVERVFGRAEGPACHKYNTFLYSFRNHYVKTKEERESTIR